MVWLAVVAFSIESDYLFSTVLWVFKSWNEEDLDLIILFTELNTNLYLTA